MFARGQLHLGLGAALPAERDVDGAALRQIPHGSLRARLVQLAVQRHVGSLAARQRELPGAVRLRGAVLVEGRDVRLRQADRKPQVLVGDRVVQGQRGGLGDRDVEPVRGDRREADPAVLVDARDRRPVRGADVHLGRAGGQAARGGQHQFSDRLLALPVQVDHRPVARDPGRRQVAVGEVAGRQPRAEARRGVGGRDDPGLLLGRYLVQQPVEVLARHRHGARPHLVRPGGRCREAAVQPGLGAGRGEARRVGRPVQGDDRGGRRRRVGVPREPQQPGHPHVRQVDLGEARAGETGPALHRVHDRQLHPPRGALGCLDALRLAVRLEETRLRALLRLHPHLCGRRPHAPLRQRRDLEGGRHVG